METIKNQVEIRHFHLFCGLGGGAKGFQNGAAQVGNLQAKFRCIGGIDNDPSAIKDFNTLVGVPGTVLDLFSREQYTAFHGKEPPLGWKEAAPLDIQAATGHETPHIVFLSPPCKGFSGLLAENLSKSQKYQALNELALRGIWLMAEAFKNDPPPLVIIENVPRIATRGRHLLDQINKLLHSYGYATAETIHDVGKIGGLSQSRKRFLLVARHTEKVPPFLYEAPQKPLHSVGELLDKCPLPGDPIAGPMHRIPSLEWKTWVRLAFVKAGSDWRSLNELNIEDGFLKDYLIIPENRHNDFLGVLNWNEPTGTVAGRSQPTNGSYSVADPRFDGQEYSQYGVKDWSETSGAVTGQSAPGGGKFSVADPRIEKAFSGKYRVTDYNNPSHTVIGNSTTGEGAFAVKDPRIKGTHHNNIYRVIRWDRSCQTITGGTEPSNGALTIADPRLNWGTERKNYNAGGHYGVVSPDLPSGAVSAAANLDNGKWSVADKRLGLLPNAKDRLICQIIAEDNTWHRPFTTYELALLQGLVNPEEELELSGLSDSAWRERIGNAVPSPAATAIASTMAKTLLMAWSGQTFILTNEPIWVRPIAVALSISNTNL